MAPLVSIIIPAYNSAGWVSDAVECSLAQTHTTCEIIVVDDGSTDATGELLERKYGPRIRLIRQENRGLAGARNTGLARARGDYIQFLDADDLLHPEKIERQLAQLAAATRPALAISDYVLCDMEDVSRIYRRHYLPPVREGTLSLGLLIEHWETGISSPVHCFLFQTRLFRERDISFDESLPNHEDWECWLRVFAQTPEVFYVNQPLALYRVRDRSMAANRPRMREGFLQAIRKQEEIHRGNPVVLHLLEKKRQDVLRLYSRRGMLAARVIEGVFRMIPRRLRRNWE
jgi:glycosyltransferase involved in cell wall biosynthesis